MGIWYKQRGIHRNYTAVSAITAGTPVRLADGFTGIVDRDIAAGATDGVCVDGIIEGDANSSDTWNDGDPLVYKASTGKLIVRTLALDPLVDLYVGTAHGAKTSGQTVAKAVLNAPSPANGVLAQTVVYEFDCETGVDATAHTLIPAALNPNGLLLLGAYGIVSEVFGGASQDQGIVTIRDSDANALCTLTPSDAGADVLNDVIVGTFDLFSAATGDAAKVVAAGKGVQGIVTQATSGASAAGKMKVYVLFAPLK